MILSKLKCPNCAGSGCDTQRGGLCRRCNGEGKSPPTQAEERRAVELAAICSCQGGTSGCTGMCCG